MSTSSAGNTRTPLPPNSIVGIFGGGQLGKMIAQSAAKLGYRAAVLDPNPDAPAMRVAHERIVAPYSDLEAAKRLAEVSQVITYEFENIPLDSVKAAATLKPVRPATNLLQVTQNRLLEKDAVTKAGASVAPYRKVTTVAELRTAVDELGVPGVLKTATLGYDGKGQTRITQVNDINTDIVSGTMVYEQLIDFEKELSVIVARDSTGQMGCFPPAENEHRNGILDVSIAPARLTPAQSAEAVAVASKIAEHLNLCGLLAVEMFLDKQGNILVNELAPRPHNSGHYTIEACHTSQFEQLVRILTGLPPGSTDLISPAVMVNLMGELWGEADGELAWHNLSKTPNASPHVYGKIGAKKGRKMGHITLLSADIDTAITEALRARNNLIA